MTPDQTGIFGAVSPSYAPGAYSGSYFLGQVYGAVPTTSTGIADAARMFAQFLDSLGPGINTSVLCPHQGATIDCNGHHR